MNWFKRIFCSQEEFNSTVDHWGLPSVDNLVPMPKVKPTKGGDISEPVLSMLETWRRNPKRFTMSVDIDYKEFHSSSFYKSAYVKLTVNDTTSNEEFIFGLLLQNGSFEDMRSIIHHFAPWFSQHKIYPVLGSKVTYKPSWMTEDELEFIIKTVKPYYLKRVNRYRDIVESRMDRSRKASELKSEIAKQKERDRLTGIYK
jgi:hypothetical protein